MGANLVELPRPAHNVEVGSEAVIEQGQSGSVIPGRRNRQNALTQSGYRQESIQKDG